jgi:hypothetical protein
MSMYFGITSPKAVARLKSQLDKLGDPKAARNVMRRTMRTVSRNMVNAFKFAAPVRSGATKKSINMRAVWENGVDSMWIGILRDKEVTVRAVTQEYRTVTRGPNAGKRIYKKREEIKRPITYAWRVNRYPNKSQGWFDTVWKLRRGEMAREMMAGVYDEVRRVLKQP